MKKDRKSVKIVRDDGFALISRILKSVGVRPTRCQIESFQTWRIKDEWKRYQEERMNNYIVAENRFKNFSLIFPNGKKGEEYNHSVKIEGLDIAFLEIDGLEDAGLIFQYSEEGELNLKGTPEKAGDFEFTIRCKLRGWEEGDKIIERKFSIAFNPDPRDLWRDLPVPEDIPFMKPNEECESVFVSEFEGRPQKDIVVASKRGRSHAQEGKPRDDHFKVSHNDENGWYTLIVADGAGSAKYSRKGSEIACVIAEEYCKTQLAEKAASFEKCVADYVKDTGKENMQRVAAILRDIVVKAAFEAHKAIKVFVPKCVGAVVKDFSTTLLIAVCKHFDFGWFIASFGVGDGAIVIYDKYAEKVRLLNVPDGGEYAGQTRFLTMDSIFSDRNRTLFSIVPDFTALMLMSDGISDPWFETDANLAKKEKWDALWEDLNRHVEFTDDNENSKNQLLSWLDFWSPGNHDDRTIAILY